VKDNSKCRDHSERIHPDQGASRWTCPGRDRLEWP